MPANLIQEYGYLAIILVTLLEGESIVILAGMAVGASQLVFGAVVVCAVLGSVAGDQFWFHIGRRWGPRVISRRSWKITADRILAQMKTRRTLVMLTFRFYYGLRTVIPAMIGAARVSPLRFLWLNLVGAVFWATTFTLGGYLLGEVLTRYFDAIKGWGIVLIVGAVLATVTVTRLVSARAAHRE